MLLSSVSILFYSSLFNYLGSSYMYMLLNVKYLIFLYIMERIFEVKLQILADRLILITESFIGLDVF